MDRQEFFDCQARDWDATRPRDVGPRLARVIGEAKLLPKQRVLDVGTGTGVLIPLIFEAVGPSGEITALDFSSEMLGAARGWVCKPMPEEEQGE
jgi:ubiquinone/menaquinone biosynthesis C-methylase UbiE